MKHIHDNTDSSHVGRSGQQNNFYGMGIAPGILETLERIKFTSPTPIQEKSIPLALEGRDIIGIAQTGTGKTHAFAVPIVQHLAQTKEKALVLAPTRELAMQIDSDFRPLAHPFGIRTACLIGGDPMPGQLRSLAKEPRIIIATPGRLLDHMQRRTVSLDKISVLVLDEADRMLDMGFAPQIERIITRIPKKRQTMLFSATIAREIMDMASRHMKLPISIEIAPSGTTVDTVTQELFIVKKESKLKLLAKLLSRYRGSVLIFTRTRHKARQLSHSIKEMGHRAAEIHSDLSQNQRIHALEGFKSGKYKILVATDIASRGIDVVGIELVLNYDLPDDTENYVHRIGRTARAGRKGYAISFAMPDQREVVRQIEKLINGSIPVAHHPEIESAKFHKPTVLFSSRSRRSRMRRLRVR